MKSVLILVVDLLVLCLSSNMHKPFVYLVAILISSALFGQSKQIDKKLTQGRKNAAAMRFDSVVPQLTSYNELNTDDLVALKIIDTSQVSPIIETCYCDTTVMVNDSISYTIVSVGNKAGVCSYFFLASLNSKSKKVIASKYLYPDCDVDYSADSYELYGIK